MTTTAKSLKGHKAFDGRIKGLMVMLHRAGWTYQRIADRLYCSKNTVIRYIKEY